MSDEESAPQEAADAGLSGVVTDVTVKALQEFDSGEMESGDKPASATGSRPQSQTGSRKGSQPGSRPASQAGSQKGSVKGSKPPSVAGSAAGSRPTSAKVGSRPTSAVQGEEPKKTSRPPSAQNGSKPTSARNASRPTSAKTGSRPTSAAQKLEETGEPDQDKEKQGSRPASQAGSQKGQQEASRPQSQGDVNQSANTPPVQSPREAQITSPREEEPGRASRDGGAEIVDTYGDPEEEAAVRRALGYDEAPEAPGGGDGGDDFGGGGGGDDDDDDEEGVDDDDDLDSDDNSDNETDMVVLDPDHPLMRRFQKALNAHLNKQNEKITLELRDLDETLRVKKKEREDLGVELYGVQQELARFQMMLEQKHDEVANLKQERQKEEQELSDVRNLYKDSQTVVNKEKKKGSELQSEVENLALRLFYMENAKEDVRSDIAVMRRAAEKVESEVTKAEMEKQKQDLFVDRLVEKVDKLKEEIAMYEAQISAQSEETKAAKESLMEAYMEIEAIELEKKDLFQKWNSSLIGMRRRDEAFAAMQEALNQQEQHILSLATEIEGYKKNIQKEQEQNEKLTLILNKTEREIELAKKHMTQVQAKHDALKAEYTTYTRMLHETEQALTRATADKNLREAEVESLRKQIEQEFLAKLKLEDEILERMRQQLTLDKASQYSKKLTVKTRERTKHLESEVADVENQIASCTLNTVHLKTRSERLKKILGELDDQIGAQNSIINKSEQEIVKRNAIIERKQNQVDIMNKKLNMMISQAGGVELGPLEIQVNSIQKSIESRNQEVMELQTQWLRQQSELVRLSQAKDSDQRDLVACKRQLTILSQKKVRTENDIDQQHREMCDIERNVRNMRNDIIKLNTLLHKEKNVGDQLEQGNILMENAFVAGLKDAEMESIQLQNQLDGIKEEKERLLNSLVEAERQIMLWEKKTQLARETRAAVDSEVGQGEMRAMKSEIHRMQVRYSQLMKQQEKMIQDMEKAVSRRDTILTRGDALSKMKKKVVTKGTFERQMNELRKKIKQTIQDANSCDHEIRDLREHQQGLSEQLEEKQVNCQQLQSTSDTLDGDLDRTLEIKQKNLSELLSKQQKMKYYQQVKEGKYTMLCKTPQALDQEQQKQEDRVQALAAIVDRLNSEFPHAQQPLRKASVALASRSDPSHDMMPS